MSGSKRAVETRGLGSKQYNRRQRNQRGKMGRAAVVCHHQSSKTVERLQFTKGCPSGKIDAATVLDLIQDVAGIRPCRHSGHDQPAGRQFCSRRLHNSAKGQGHLRSGKISEEFATAEWRCPLFSPRPPQASQNAFTPLRWGVTERASSGSMRLYNKARHPAFRIGLN
jgi:hypothetical protein